ncbi:MAG: DUF1015 domain-containing protein [Actinobacteria bacterium]|nr:DUF1015 domain-containing protein [Actinomycetota bacterium]
MPRFEPFTALRYATTDLNAVAAPPYDVLSESDRAELAARHENNIVHVDVPRESDGPTRYSDANTVLRAWVTNGVLVRDSRPSFSIYRMSFRDESGRPRTTVGVIGALEVVDEGAGGVLPHERTTPKAKTDRLDLTRATLTNLSPVWGLSLAAGLTDLLMEPGEVTGVVEADGVVHTIERVDDPARVAAISNAIGSADVVIADGHHRYAISRTFRDEQRAADTGTNGSAELTMTYIGELIEEQLSVDAIHRLYTGIDSDALLSALSEFFETSPAGPVNADITHEMRDRGSLVFVHADGTGTYLTPKADKFANVRDLDGARLEHALANVKHEVTYQHGVGLVRDIVTSGGATAGVLIRPVTVREIQRTADEGLLMPPKSTFFTPKLRTGPVIRPLF